MHTAPKLTLLPIPVLILTVDVYCDIIHIMHTPHSDANYNDKT
jgi:hypothetical protein